MSQSELFSPVRLGAIDLKNRIVMAPLTRSRANSFAVPSDLAVQYYAQRASAGLLITEATQVSNDAMGYPRTPGVYTAQQKAAWRRIIDAVHEAGGKIVVQLWHVGRVASVLNRGYAADVVSASAIRAPGQMYTDAKGLVDHDLPRALETSEIAGVASDFAEAAAGAIDIGFDGIELHSANGYLLHQFLSSNVNQRDDRYGGSIENRVRMPLEVLEAILAKVPSERVGVRVSPGHTFNGIEERDTTELYAHYLKKLESYGLAYLHVMRPMANTLDWDVVEMARGFYSGKMIACGGYNAETGAALIRSGTADAVAYGKLYIANPDLVERFRNNAPLNEPQVATFYAPGEQGYTDYPTLSEAAA